MTLPSGMGYGCLHATETDRLAATEVAWPAKPKLLTIWLFYIKSLLTPGSEALGLSPSISSKVCSEPTSSWKPSSVRPLNIGGPFAVPLASVSVFLRHLPCTQYLLGTNEPREETDVVLIP